MNDYHIRWKWADHDDISWRNLTFSNDEAALHHFNTQLIGTEPFVPPIPELDDSKLDAFDYLEWAEILRNGKVIFRRAFVDISN